MTRDNIEWFRCVSCNASNWQLSGDTGNSEVVEGVLACRGCGASYPVRSGIPRFVAGENYSQSFGFQWNTHRTAQLDSHSGVPISRRRLFEETGWPADLTGQHILEAGSGAGRFTEVLAATGAVVFSFDYSTAVDANRLNNGSCRRVHFFQANILDIPVVKGSFDKVLCLGVLQHTPDPELALKSLGQYVRPGGELVIDCYKKSLRSLVHWKYALRPITKRMEQGRLHRFIERVVPPLLPVARVLRRIAGAPGVRLLPILEYSHLGLPNEVAAEWAVLDTFDMYSPAHDHPQSAATLRRWFQESGLTDVEVRRGWNGFVARGRRSAPVTSERK